MGHGMMWDICHLLLGSEELSMISESSKFSNLCCRSVEKSIATLKEKVACSHLIQPRIRGLTDRDGYAQEEFKVQITFFSALKKKQP